MSLWRLMLHEITHRSGGFLLALAAVAVAVGGLTGSTVFLRAFDRDTERIVAEKEDAAREQMAAMEDEYRKITKEMGFNVLILPKGLDLTDFYAEGYADVYMPEDFATKLAETRTIVTIRHLLPMLQQKVEWPERKRKILVIGVRGEMPWAHRSNKKPLLKPVPPGTVTVGYELHRSLALRGGDTIEVMGRSFTVGELHPERGTVDDITLWIDMAEAQAMLDKRGLINAMLALECSCAWAEVGKVRRDIEGVLPETQVVELAGKALARAEARREAARNAQLVVAREKTSREELRRQREGLASMIVPLVIVLAAVFVGVLALTNARGRRSEIALLRAVGLMRRQVLLVLLGRSVLVGAIGAAVGIVAGVASGMAVSGIPADAPGALEIVDVRLLVAVVLAAPLVAGASGWIPAVLAAGQDPAEILREE